MTVHRGFADPDSSDLIYLTKACDGPLKGRLPELESERTARPAAAVEQAPRGGWEGSRPWRGGCTAAAPAAAAAAAALLTAIGPAAGVPTCDGAGRGRLSPTVHVLRAGCAGGAVPGGITVLERLGRWPGPRPALCGEGRALRGGGQANTSAATEILHSEADAKAELGTQPL